MRRTLCTTALALALALCCPACSDDTAESPDSETITDAGPDTGTDGSSVSDGDHGQDISAETAASPDGYLYDAPYTPDGPAYPDGPYPLDGPYVYDAPTTPDGPVYLDGPYPLDGPYVYDAPTKPDGPVYLDGPYPLDGPYVYDAPSFHDGPVYLDGPYPLDGPYVYDAPSFHDGTILPDIHPMPDGIILPDGGTDDAGAMQQCQWMNVQYMAELKKAKVCSPLLPVVHCTHLVKDRLICPCTTYVEAVSSDMLKLETAYLDLDCASFFICPAIVCPTLTGADCATSSSTTAPGTCVDK